MNTSVRLLVIAGLIVVACSFASAEITPATYSSALTFTSNGTATLTLPRFDAQSYANEWGAATLNSVTVVFEDRSRVRLTVTVPTTYTDEEGNTLTNSAVTGQGRLERHWSVTGIPGATTGFNVDHSQNGTPFTSNPGDPAFVDMIVTTWPQYATAYTYAPGTLDADAYLYDGTGPNTASMLVSVNNYTNTVDASGGVFSLTPDWSSLNIRASVQYNYTLASNPGVPEPSSLALLPMAFTGLIFWRRRRIA